MLTLEETVKELKKYRGCHDLSAEYPQRNGLSSALMEFEANGQRDVNSGVISLLSEDEESDSRSSSPTVGLGGTTPMHTVTLSTHEWADALMTGQRECPRQRSLRRSPPRREQSRSRSPLRQNASGTSRRDRECSPSESTCTSRTACRPRRPLPFTPSSPSASSTSTNTFGNSDSVVQLIERRQSGPLVINDSSSVDSPRIIGEIRHNVTGSEVMGFDRIPERAVFWTPPGSTQPSAYFGDREVEQWLNRVIGESPSSSSSIRSSNSSNSSSSPSTSC